MSSEYVLQFVEKALVGKATGKSVLEVGAFDVNGSPRALIQAQQPDSYIGVDIEAGPGVDEVVSVHDLVQRFGEGRFDVVVSTEMVEHVEDWRSAFRQMFGVTAPGGTLVVTTRSRNFPFHAYPHDYWRYECEDFRRIFAGWHINALEQDPAEPGVFVAAQKATVHPSSAHLDSIKLFSMQHDRRVLTTDASRTASSLWRMTRRAAPSSVRGIVKQLVSRQ